MEKTKAEYILDVLNLFVQREIPKEMVENYLRDPENHYLKLADEVKGNLKFEIDWSTAIGAIEAAEHMYREAVVNANIRGEAEKSLPEAVTDKFFIIKSKDIPEAYTSKTMNVFSLATIIEYLEREYEAEYVSHFFKEGCENGFLLRRVNVV